MVLADTTRNKNLAYTDPRALDLQQRLAWRYLDMEMERGEGA